MLDNIKDFIKKVYAYMMKPEMLTLPSSLAYYFVLAVVPIVSIVLLIASNLNLSTNYITSFFKENFSSELIKLIKPMVTNQSLSFGFIVYLFVAFYIVSNGANAIIVASNMIFNIKNKDYFHRRIKAFVMAILLVFLFAFMLIVPVFGEQLIKLFVSMGVNNRFTDFLQMLYPVLRLPISLIVIYLAIKSMYIIAPDEEIKGKYVTKGTVFTTVGWVIATFAYSYYVKNIASYNLYYAGLSNLVMIMIWFYFLAFIFVIGLSMNYQNTEKQIERTNAIKLKEIEEKVKASKRK